jgi:hypothetical protein
MNGRESRRRDSLWLSLLPRSLRFESQLEHVTCAPAVGKHC